MPRAALTRERVLQAAVGLADESGIESITMRKLGRALGVEAMSLYNHVANKDDVLNGLLDLVLDETEPPAPEDEWDVAVRRSAISVHDALRRHPWAAPLLMSEAHIRPARMRYMDLLLGCLREARFSAETTFHAYHVIDGHIIGFSLWEITHSSIPLDASDLAGMVDRLIPVDEYPYLHEHGKQHVTEGPHRKVSAFEFGLDLILDGLRKIHDPV